MTKCLVQLRNLVVYILVALLVVPWVIFSQPKTAQAGNCIQEKFGEIKAALEARFGGVSLNQAATFLADMSDVVGAYYDEGQDRIVFVGKKNTAAPKFDKDDLAVAIRSIYVNKTDPAFSLDPQDPNNPYEGDFKAVYYGGIEDTQFGQTMLDADLALKYYSHGSNQNHQTVQSSVPGYKSFFDLFLSKNPPIDAKGASRFWIVPQQITLKRDATGQAFMFDTVKMQVLTEGLEPTNDPRWNQAAIEFTAHQTQNYDAFAAETPAYAKTKQLAKLVALVKWIRDNNLKTDMAWVDSYKPNYVATPRTVPQLTTTKEYQGYQVGISGGIDISVANSYQADDGRARTIEATSEAAPNANTDIHWSFNQSGQTYESVAVSAQAFRSLGAYATSATDLSIPTRGDQSLSINRTYSSFNGGDTGVGRGWDMVPARLVDALPGRISSCVPTVGYRGQYPAKLAFETQSGSREVFTYQCNFTYKPDDPAYHSQIIRNNDGSYTAKLKDQTEYLFDINFKLKERKDKNGNKIFYGYDGLNKLTTINDGNGHQLSLSYNAQGQLIQASDWTGRATKYEYTNNNLTAVIDPRGGITRYSYDSSNRLNKIVDRLGKTILENTYNSENKVATQKDASGKTVSMSYDVATKTITLTDSNGRIAKTLYDDKARITKQTDSLNRSVLFSYGTEFSPITTTDKLGNRTSYTYDALGNLTSITGPNSKRISYTYDTANRLTKTSDSRYGTAKDTSYTYDTKGNLLKLTEQTRSTSFTYDQYGEVATETNPLGKVTTYTRDSFGNPLTIKDPLSKVTTFGYDGLGRVTTQTDPDNKSTAFAYDANSNLLSRTDSIGKTEYVYDAENKTTKATDHNGAASQYQYDNAGNLTSVTDAAGGVTAYSYDAYGNPTVQRDAMNRSVRYSYDTFDQLKQTTTDSNKTAKWDYDANGNIIKRTDGAGKITTYGYDILNRLATITYPDSKKTTFAYDDRGNLLKMVDPTGTSSYTYDTFDRLTASTNPYGQTLRYTYNAGDQLTRLTYPDNKYVDYTYDNASQLATATDWNGQKVSYQYNGNGLVASRTLPNGVATNYAYDNANRLTSLEHLKGQTSIAKYLYERDKNGNITKATEQTTTGAAPTPSPSPSLVPSPSPSPSPIPSPSPSPTPPTGQPDLVITNITITPDNPTTRQYTDIAITVKNQGTVASTDSFRVGLYYDETTAPTTATSYDDSVTYYDDLLPGQSTVVTESLVRFSTAGTHTVHALVDRALDITESNETNNLFGPVTINATLASLFRFNSSPFAKLLTDFVPSAIAQQVVTTTTTAFAYDPLQRLTQAVYPENTTFGYSYDKAGNRLTQNVGSVAASYTYNNDNEMTQAGPTTVSYDQNGNLTKKTDSSKTELYSYDFDDRLVSYTKSATAGVTELSFALATETLGSIDIGSDSIPAFGDLDGDDDLDLLIGNSSGTIAFYRNTGTATSPTYTLVSAAYGSIDIGYDSSPTLADTDNDGDLDLYIGTSTGTIAYYLNTGTKTNPVHTLQTATFGTIDIGSNSSPRFADLDADGDLDLGIGTSAGTFSFYRNTGTKTAATFQLVSASMDSIDVGSDSVPAFVDFDQDTDLDLLSGDSSGLVKLYSNTGTKTAPRFVLSNANLNTIDVGSSSSLAVADLNKDTIPDLLIGEYTGNINHYLGSRVTKANGVTTTFAYDGLGNRLQKTTGTAVTRYTSDTSSDLAKVMVENDGTNKPKSYYAYGLGLTSQGAAAAADRQYPLEDGLSNVRLITNNAGAVVSSYQYDPFGNNRGVTGAESNFKFTGEQVDSESGLYYLRARYYDASNGRFITKDPVRGLANTPQTLNPYLYVVNNPVNMTDPSGKIAPLLIAAWAVLNTAWDIGNVAYDLCTGNNVALAIDLVAMDNPLVPGGAGLLGLAAKSVGKNAAQAGISIAEKDLAHVIERHTVNGLKNNGTSIFAEGVNLKQLVKEAESITPVLQSGGNYERIIDAGKVIGTDRATGAPTAVYTVITRSDGSLVTAFPGRP